MTCAGSLKGDDPSVLRTSQPADAAGFDPQLVLAFKPEFGDRRGAVFRRWWIAPAPTSQGRCMWGTCDPRSSALRWLDLSMRFEA
jgi:hypothetical protein